MHGHREKDICFSSQLCRSAAGLSWGKQGNCQNLAETVGAIAACSSFGMFAVCAALCAPLSQYVKDRLNLSEGSNNLVSEAATFLFLGESWKKNKSWLGLRCQPWGIDPWRTGM